jgi:hypothetical protein
MRRKKVKGKRNKRIKRKKGIIDISLSHPPSTATRSCIVRRSPKRFQLHQQICFTSTTTTEAVTAVPNTLVILPPFFYI